VAARWEWHGIGAQELAMHLLDTDGVEAVISCIGPEKNLSPGTLMSVGVAGILIECKRVQR
jgi:hypothetical protein